MERRKIKAPKRNFKIRGRGSALAAPRKPLVKNSPKTFDDLATGAQPLSPASVGLGVPSVVKPTTGETTAAGVNEITPPQSSTPQEVKLEPKPKPIMDITPPPASAPADTTLNAPTVGRKTPPITSSMHTSRGVYIDTVKKPTLSGNARVSLNPIEKNEPPVKLIEKEQIKPQEVFPPAIAKVNPVKPINLAAENALLIKESAPLIKDNTALAEDRAPQKKDEPKPKKKKFLFW